MIVACTYIVHDYHSQLFVLDTELLDVTRPFLNELKRKLETAENLIWVIIDGNKYGDDVFDAKLGLAKVDLPVKIDVIASIRVKYD